MRITDLPFLNNFVSNSHQLAKEVTAAINQVKVYELRSPGSTSPAKAKLIAFLDGAKALLEEAGPGTVKGTVSTGGVKTRTKADAGDQMPARMAARGVPAAEPDEPEAKEPASAPLPPMPPKA